MKDLRVIENFKFISIVSEYSVLMVRKWWTQLSFMDKTDTLTSFVFIERAFNVCLVFFNQSIQKWKPLSTMDLFCYILMPVDAFWHTFKFIRQYRPMKFTFCLFAGYIYLDFLGMTSQPSYDLFGCFGPVFTTRCSIVVIKGNSQKDRDSNKFTYPQWY